MNIHISEHAVKRYRERIGQLSDDRSLARLEMFEELAKAKPKHFKKLGARTAYVPTPECVFIFEGGSLVTVLSRREPARNAA